MKLNFIELSDSYKYGHSGQYPEGTQGVYANYESRLGAEYPETTFMGLQMIVMDHMTGQVVLPEHVQDTYETMAWHFGNANIFPLRAWNRVATHHNGHIPIHIKAIPEGMTVPVGNVMMTVESTDAQLPWMTNFCESLLQQVWYPSTVATRDGVVKKMILNFLERTAMSSAGADFMLHDFGFRGASSPETAAIGGCAHLVYFKGTDTIVGMRYAREFYGAKTPGFSVPATEHSVMTALGPDGELAQFERVLDLYPTGIVSVVSDSYDIKRAVSQYVGIALRDKILARDGVFVLRPDSGDPIEVSLMVLDELAKAFGTTTNAKGYKVLNPRVRMIWGDGLDINGIQSLLYACMSAGYSVENMVFGMGGGLLQRVHRDMQRSAFKCSAQKRDGIWHDVYKKPTDITKASKRGRLALVRGETGFKTVPLEEANGHDILEDVFRDGVMLRKHSFDEVRANAMK